MGLAQRSQCPRVQEQVFSFTIGHRTKQVARWRAGRGDNFFFIASIFIYDRRWVGWTRGKHQLKHQMHCILLLCLYQDGLNTYAFDLSLGHAFRKKINLCQDWSCAMTAALLALALLFHASFGAPQNAKEGHLGVSNQAEREVSE